MSLEVLPEFLVCASVFFLMLELFIRFVYCLFTFKFSCRDFQVAWDISFQINAENSLTEPYVAHVISKSMSAKSALFVGNSMAIRDIDMYGCNWESQYAIPGAVLNLELQCLGVRVAGNRGASGIDGLLSTGIGFATGSNKKVSGSIHYPL